MAAFVASLPTSLAANTACASTLIVRGPARHRHPVSFSRSFFSNPAFGTGATRQHLCIAQQTHTPALTHTAVSPARDEVGPYLPISGISRAVDTLLQPKTHLAESPHLFQLKSRRCFVTNTLNSLRKGLASRYAWTGGPIPHIRCCRWRPRVHAYGIV